MTQVEHQVYVQVRRVFLTMEMLKSKDKRRSAAAKQVKAMEAAFEAGTVTIDQLLEAQRRLAEADMSYVRTACELYQDETCRELRILEAKLAVTSEALNRARKTWQKVYALYRTGSRGGEASIEAQRREQFYQFKKQYDSLLSQHLQLDSGSMKGTTRTIEQSKAGQAGASPPSIVVFGPIIEGKLPPAFAPPSEDEVLRAVELDRARRGDTPSHHVPRHSQRIVKEKIAEYIDLPRNYPLLGRAQLHHVHYKCTLYYSEAAPGDSALPGEKQRDNVEEVVFVDQLHYCTSAKEDTDPGAAMPSR